MPSSKKRASKRRALAQNFLADQRVAESIVDLLAPAAGDLVLDLGAGGGALTEPLARRGAKVTAVERDPRWAEHLRRKAPGWGGVRVVEGDALRVPLPAAPHRVVSNAPYNLGTRMLRRVVSESHGLLGAVFVLQAEAARRLAGDPAPGRFAATWSPWFAFELGPPIPPSAFRPRPAVMSAPLEVRPRTAPLLSPAAFDGYERFLERLFSGRGATVLDRLARTPRHAAGGDGRPAARKAMRSAGVPVRAVPSELGPEDFVALFLAWVGGPP